MSENYDGNNDSSDNELKRKIEELKEKNDVLGLSVQRSRHVVRRLKLEYGVLLERLESRVKIDPELNYQNPLPTLETFKSELLSNPLKRPKNKRQRTKERDPNMPKRPTNAYLLYCEMNKDRIRQNGSFDVTKDLTEGWKSLSEEERAPYYKLYNEDRKRYHAEMEEYNRKLDSAEVAEGEEVAEDEEGEGEGEGECEGEGEGEGEGDNDAEVDVENEGEGDNDAEVDVENEDEEDEEDEDQEEQEEQEEPGQDEEEDNDDGLAATESEKGTPVKDSSVTTIQNDFKEIKKQRPNILNPMTEEEDNIHSQKKKSTNIA